MASVGTLGSALPLGPQSIKVKYQAFPQDGSIGLKQPATASLPVRDNHQGSGAKVLDVAGRP